MDREQIFIPMAVNKLNISSIPFEIVEEWEKVK